MNPATWLLIGSISGFLAVALGAFGAHALAASLAPRALEIYQTAAQYQMMHALALVLVGVLGLWNGGTGALPHFWISWSGASFAIGTLVFSGSLYALALTDIKILGAITPIGGLAFMSGWIGLAVAAFRAKAGE